MAGIRSALIGIGQSGIAQNMPALIQAGQQADEWQTKKKALDFQLQQEKAKMESENKMILVDLLAKQMGVPKDDPHAMKMFTDTVSATGLGQNISTPDAVDVPGQLPSAIPSQPKLAIKAKDIQTLKSIFDNNHSLRSDMRYQVYSDYSSQLDTEQSKLDNLLMGDPNVKDPKTIKQKSIVDSLTKNVTESFNRYNLDKNLGELQKTYTTESISTYAHSKNPQDLVTIPKLDMNVSAIDLAARQIGLQNASMATPEQAKKINEILGQNKIDTIKATQDIKVSGDFKDWTPEVISKVASEFRHGTKLTDLGLSSRPGSAPMIAKVYLEADRQAKAEGDLAWSRGQSIAIRQATTQATTTLTKQLAVREGAEKGLENEINRVVTQLSPKVPRTEISVANYDKYLSGKYIGNPDVINLFNGIKAVSTEYARVIEGQTGVAATTVSGREAAQEMIPLLLGQQSLESVLASLKANMRNVIAGNRTELNQLKDSMNPHPKSVSPQDMSNEELLKALGQ